MYDVRAMPLASDSHLRGSSTCSNQRREPAVPALGKNLACDLFLRISLVNIGCFVCTKQQGLQQQMRMHFRAAHFAELSCASSLQCHM